jgi:hypothetical protein
MEWWNNGIMGCEDSEECVILVLASFGAITPILPYSNIPLLFSADFD